MFKLQRSSILSGLVRGILLLLVSVQLVSAQVVLALKDPTQPSSYRAVSKKQSLRLESILFSDARKVAVINGTVVAEGDSIGNAKIIRIDRDSVRVSSGGNSVELVLHRAAIRQEK